MCTQLPSTLSRSFTWAPMLRLEKDAAAERNPVAAEKTAGRTIVNGEAQPGPDVDGLADVEPGREACGRIVRLAGRVERPKDIGLERDPKRLGDCPAAQAEHDVGSPLDPAEVGREFHVMNIDAAKYLGRLRGAWHGSGREQQATGIDKAFQRLLPR